MLKDPLKSHTAINKDKRLKDKPKPKQLICQICENIFSSNQDKLKHCNEEHKGNQVKCNKNECSCNKLFKARKGLRRHLKSGNAFTCKFCKATFSTKQERSEHCRNEHVYQYTCKQENCGELFESKVDLFYHASKEHKYMVKKWWTCDICEEKLAPKSALEKHSLKEHAGKRVLCTIENCGSQFRLKQNLWRHMNEKHKFRLKRRWPCEFCEKSFVRNTLRQKHTKIIHEGKLFKCTECLLQYHRKESLESHLNLVHKNVRFKCSDCEYQNSSSRYLNRHKKLKHSENSTQTKKFQCPDCEKMFRARKTLKLHQMSKHEGWRVQCHLCEKWLSSNRSFRQHFNFFHEKRSQSKCDKCDYAGFNMSYHKMKYHKLTYPCVACNFIGKSKEEIKLHKKKHEEDCHEIGEESPECGFVQMQEKNIKESDNTEKKEHEQRDNKIIIREHQLDSDLVCEELPMFKKEIENQISEKKPVLITESLMHEYEEKRKEQQAEMLMKCFSSSQLTE